MKIIRELLGYFSQILFPPLCLFCKRHIKNKSGVLCRECYESIPLTTAFLCGGCMRRIPTIAGKVRKCKCKESIIFGAASTYTEGQLHELITALKYRGVTAAAEPLGELMERFTQAAKFDASGFMLVPMPLSASRKRIRGYNQAELIARAFLRALPKATQELRTDIIKRQINAGPQTSMRSRELRKENVRGAFAVINPGAVRGKHVLLIDDVYTSGATAREASSVLKSAGARRVIVLTAAHA